jgi:hypothetical protein
MIFQISYLLTSLLNLALELQLLLLTFVLLELEFNPFFWTNPIYYKPLIKTHNIALGISWGWTGKWTIIFVKSITGDLRKWNVVNKYVNSTIYKPLLLLLFSLDIYLLLRFQFVHYGITGLVHITTLLPVLILYSINLPIYLSI